MNDWPDAMRPGRPREAAQPHVRSGAAAFALAAAAGACMPPAAAATIEAPSRITEVTLYLDAAIVKRRLVVEVPVGDHEIQLADLPAALDPASLRVEGSASERVVIGNVDFRARPAASDAEKPETQRRLKALREDRERNADRIDAVEGRKAMIQRLAQVSEGKDAKPLDIDQWSKAWDLVGKGLQSANEELRGFRIEQARIDAEITALEQASGDLRRRPPANITRLATIAVEASAASQLELTVSYRVSGASWRPIYDARLDTRGAVPVLELIRRAMVRQNTGEDWPDAKLTLSTLAVTRGTAVPALRGERVALYERPVARPAPYALQQAPGSPAPDAARSALDETEALRQKAAAPRRAEAVAVEEQGSAVEAGAYQTEFALPGTITLPAGGAEKSVRLGTEKPEPKLLVRAAPALDPTAYLEASFQLGGETPLLAGEVLLTRDNALIGRGRVPLVAPGDIAKLGFGSDDRIRITRIPTAHKLRDPGFLGSTRSDRYEFKTTIKNLHAFPVNVVIEDRIPVSEDQSILVERLAEMTKPDTEAPDDRRGVFAWSPTLKAQEERAYITAYRLRWPSAKEIRVTPLPL